MGDRDPLCFEPHLSAPRHMYVRAIRQRTSYCGYERLLAVGERVTITLTRGETGFEVGCAADGKAEARGKLVR